MDVKEAVQIARQYAATVFEGETIRIEEVWFEAVTSEWCVTVGLPRSEPSSGFDAVLGKRLGTRMHYKTIRIDDNSKEIKSVRNHDKMPVSPS
ncbi:MAG: hypothetical protein ABL898_19800 [Hyphomicrobiaceae bacterium]